MISRLEFHSFKREKQLLHGGNTKTEICIP